jgi:8-oxo-dGTP diphosphatase
VGVGVIVLRDGQVLLGKRKGSHGAGTWALPGGHLEFGESVEACAVRETEEETGLQVQVIGHGPYTNDVMPNENKHYVTVFVLARGEQGAPEVREPEKCEGWSWFRWSELPSNLFVPLRNLISQGYTPSGA